MTSTNYLQRGDSTQLLQQLPARSVDLIVTDPPYNIGVPYDVATDLTTKHQYDEWCQGWLTHAATALKPGGSMWVFINDENVSELDVSAKSRDGLTKRQHVIWYYTFGQNCAKKLARSHTHILHYVKLPAATTTFNKEDILVPSMRQLEYKDKRAASAGKLPDDTWVLNPKYMPEGFSPHEDTWHVPRVCGTFKEKQATPNQLPELLVARIIRLCSNPGDVVLDMFAGSGTVPAVAKKLGRNYIGFDLSPNYIAAAQQRVDSVSVGDPLF